MVRSSAWCPVATSIWRSWRRYWKVVCHDPLDWAPHVTWRRSMSQIPAGDPTTRLFLRHALATLAYRAGKTVRGTPDAFADYRASDGSPSPREILAHMGDLMDWVLTQLKGAVKWNNSTPLE